jgi:hypothetical protein
VEAILSRSQPPSWHVQSPPLEGHRKTKAKGVYDGRPPSIEAARLRELKALKIGRASFYRVQGPPPGQGGVGRFTPGRRPGPIGAMPCDRQLSIGIRPTLTAGGEP